MKQLIEDRIAPRAGRCAVASTVPPTGVDDGAHASASAVDGHRLKCAEHSHVFREGDKADRIFQVGEGAVMLYKLLPDGRRQVVELIGPGDVFGLSSLKVYDCSAETLAATQVTAYDRGAVERSPGLLRLLSQCVHSQICALHEHAVLLGRKSALERVATFLMRHVPHRGQYGCNGPRGRGDGAVVHLSMTRQEIADYLGLTIETVSRAFSELRRRGLVSIEKLDEVQINDVCRICRLTGAH